MLVRLDAFIISLYQGLKATLSFPILSLLMTLSCRPGKHTSCLDIARHGFSLTGSMVLECSHKGFGA